MTQFSETILMCNFFMPFIAFLVLSMTRDLVLREYNIILGLTANFLSAIFTLFYIMPTFIFSSKMYYIDFSKWFSYGNTDIFFGLCYNTLTVSMACTVLMITHFVITYSADYMSEDPRIETFISFLSLFNFSMNIFVFSSTIFMAFLGWEAVGVTSYLLIKFWDTRMLANKAAIKAIVINKVGDLFFMVSLAFFYYCFQTFDYEALYVLAPMYKTFYYLEIEALLFDIMCISIVLAAATKSAQIGLHMWLPDAMEGPSPVSALLHAATMVTAGVFLIVRCYPILQNSSFALIMLIFFGSLTCVFAGTTAIFQNDLKRVIAYSTCAQLGVMIQACGLAAPEFAMFHLINHSFFKALLFLSAGAIIHALKDEQDIRKMGGLVNLLPFSYFCLFLGSAALMGIPFLTGFYSKEGIITLSFYHGSLSKFSYLLGLFAATTTIIYSIRLISLTFFNTPNTYRQTTLNLHEAPFLMTLSMFFLVCGSLSFGYFAQDFFIGFGSNSLGYSVNENKSLYKADFEFTPFYIKLIPLVLILITVSFLYFYSPRNKLKSVYYFLNNRWTIDYIYSELISKPVVYVSERYTLHIVDRGLLEWCGPYGLAQSINYLVSITRGSQTGYISSYIFYILVGVAYILLIICFNVAEHDVKTLIICMCSYIYIRKFL